MKLHCLFLWLTVFTITVITACSPANTNPLGTQPISSSSITSTVSPTEVQIIATVEATKTRKPRATIRMFVPSETPFASPNPTDAAMYAQMTNALEATTTLISSLPNASRDEIAKALLIKWLDYYKTNKVDPYLRLKSYKIEEVNATSGYCPPPDKDTRKFAALAHFFIQTVTLHSGNWMVLTDGIEYGNSTYRLSVYISISANKDTYYTLSMEGSGPCGPPV